MAEVIAKKGKWCLGAYEKKNQEFTKLKIIVKLYKEL
jgi:hypothetical protein